MSTFELSSPSEIKVKILFFSFLLKKKTKREQIEFVVMINQMREEIFFTCSLTSKCFLSMLKEKKEMKNICLHRNKFIRVKIASRTDFLSLFFGGIGKLFIEFLRSNSLNRNLFFVFGLLSSGTLLFDVFVLLKSYSKEFDMKTEDS